MKLGLTDEQRNQLEEGRRRARGEDKPVNTSQKPLQGPSKPQKLKSKGKPAHTGHDALLERLKNVGGRVRLRLLDYTAPLVGKVMHFDKFTVSVLVESYDGDDYAPGETAVIFKHALASFVALEKTNV